MFKVFHIFTVEINKKRITNTVSIEKNIFFGKYKKQLKNWVCIKNKKNDLPKKTFYRLNKSVNRNKNLIQGNDYINT